MTRGKPGQNTSPPCPDLPAYHPWLQEATPTLYSLIFGEGVVNDATSIVLLRAVQKIRHGT